MPDRFTPPDMTFRLPSFDSALGNHIIALYVWAVRQGLGGAAAATLLDGLCQRLVIAGVPLWRGFAGMRTMHPQWGGYSYIWRRDLNAIQPAQFERGDQYEQDLQSSPFSNLIRQSIANGGGPPWLYLRRHLAGPEAQLDFPILKELAASGATDYFAELFRFGEDGDPSRGSAVGFSFVTDRTAGFHDDDLTLFHAVLPAASLAMMADASHAIASGILQAYLGSDAGQRVHSGAIIRGSVESIHAVIWYADIRGFTAIADTIPGLEVIELLDEVFETLTGLLRASGGQVLKFLGDGMLATFQCVPATRRKVCRQALDAAREAMQAIDKLNATRRRAGKPVAEVDLALHFGEVLYGNVGAIDRLDFTVIGPAVNEAARMEALCQPLGCKVLVSAELTAAVGDDPHLYSLGSHMLRGVRDGRELYGLDLG
jgi:adenylate cyclase